MYTRIYEKLAKFWAKPDRYPSWKVGADSTAPLKTADTKPSKRLKTRKGGGG